MRENHITQYVKNKTIFKTNMLSLSVDNTKYLKNILKTGVCLLFKFMKQYINSSFPVKYATLFLFINQAILKQNLWIFSETASTHDPL